MPHLYVPVRSSAGKWLLDRRSHGPLWHRGLVALSGTEICSITNLGVINTSVSRPRPRLVEMGGQGMECKQGERAEYAVVAAILFARF
jgi:hypothetical protein